MEKGGSKEQRWGRDALKFEFFSERVRDKDLDKDAEGSEQCCLLEELKYHPLYQFNRGRLKSIFQPFCP